MWFFGQTVKTPITRRSSGVLITFSLTIWHQYSYGANFITNKLKIFLKSSAKKTQN